VGFGRRGFFARSVGGSVATIFGAKDLETSLGSALDQINPIEQAVARGVPVSASEDAARKAMRLIYEGSNRMREARKELREGGNDPDIDARVSCSPVYRRALMIQRLYEEKKNVDSLWSKIWGDDEDW
jgi:hypothetical protein